MFQQGNTRMKLACTIGVKRIAYPIPQIAQKIDVPVRKYSWAFYKKILGSLWSIATICF